MISTKKNERRDWTLLIFIIPIGIILIILVGQFAVRLVPFWSVNADMNSNLEPDPASARPFALLEPILPQILTPMAWAQTYLTPGAEISFPPFLTFEPTASPSPTPVTPTPTPTSTSEPPTPTATTPSPTSTVVVATTPPASGGGDGGGGSGSPTTCQDPTADNFGGALPCDFTSTTTCTDPTADNFGGALPCDYTSTTTCTDPTADNFGGALPCDYTSTTTCQVATATNYGDPLPCIYPPGITSTVDVSLYGTPVTPIPSPIGVGATPDNSAFEMTDGTYLVIKLNVEVGTTSDNNYDLVLYEYNNGGTVYLDWMIVGISKSSTGSEYYEVFTWGNTTRDENTNIDTADLTPSPDCPTNTECDDRHFDPSDPNDLHNGTGVLIDVDTAISSPPPDTYEYIVIISPFGGSAGGTQIDAIQTVEIPTP